DIADSSHIQVIYVASGEYHESVVINSAVTIYGSRDPSTAWLPSRVDSTVLFGETIDGRPVAVLVQDVSATVSLRSLTIIAADATEPGEGSYGVSCVNSSDVDFRDCSIRSGNGAPGIPGEDGTPGYDKPAGSQARGGEGGLGWHATGYWVCDSVTCYYFVCLGGAAAEPGNPGHCFDGSLTGGTGGDEGQNGEDGQDGVPGSDGKGGNGAITIVADGELVLAAVGDGGDGGEGGYGCGGGGGGGAGGTYCMPCWETGPGYPADAGGWGGGGAGPGTGGTGGKFGGCSIALLGYNSSVRLSRCRVSSGSGGDGGDAGAGGVGGAGQAGGAPVKDGICSWPAGWGGDGGDGGRGGHGGGGAGGASIAVAALGVSSVQYSLDTEFIPGQPGKGGASEGNPGEDGVQDDVYGDGAGK
ncbi:MAG: hypothetical protein PVH24_05990, partial [Candidatus Zixiibacteriota bacterium]